MISIYPPNRGGTEMHTYTLAKELVKKGHEVFIVVPPYEGSVEDINGIHVIEGKMINIPYLKEISFMILSKKILDNLVKKENIDIIHSHSLFGGGIIANKIGKKYNIPTYVTVHSSRKTDILRNPLGRLLAKKTLDKADNVLVVSNAVKNEVFNYSNIENIREKTSLHLNAVDIDKFQEKPFKNNKKQPIVIFVGHLEKRKNVNLLLDAKKQSNIDYDLILVGDGIDKNKLKKRVKKENINDVTFMGNIKNVEEILPKADLLVLPSISEAFGIVLIEALACGLPVIGSNVEGIKEIITPDVGLLIDPYSAISLCNAIDKILSDKKLYNKFKSNARKRAMEFSEMKIPYKELK